MVCLKLVSLAEEQSKVAFFAPVNVIPAPDALAVVPPAPAVALKSMVPLLTILPPTTSEWVVIVLVEPEGALRKTLPFLTVTIPVIVIVLPVPVSYCRIPAESCPIVREPIAGVSLSMVTVAPSAIVTSSPAAGTTPPTQVEGFDQLPPTAVLFIVAPLTAPANEIKMNAPIKNLGFQIKRSSKSGLKSKKPGRVFEPSCPIKAG